MRVVAYRPAIDADLVAVGVDLLIRPAHGLSVHGNGAAPDERADRLSASDIFICQKFIQSHVRIPFLYLRGGFRCNEMRAVRRKTVHEAILGF